MRDRITPTVWYTDVKKFFDQFLSPTENLLVKRHPEGSIAFRGQTNANWPLLPSAFRGDSWLTDGRSWARGRASNSLLQIRFEALTRRAFFNVCDQQGLKLPEDGQELRLTFDKLSNIEHSLDAGEFDKEFRKWPSNRVLSLMALAQHSGIPTRLLDWTWNAYTAAYFAASGCLSKESPVGDLAVWAIDLTSIKKVQLQSCTFASTPDQWPLRVISAPAADNRNLKAQQGLFTLQTAVDETKWQVGIPLDETITNLIESLHPTSRPLLMKATLPASAACDLLLLLRRQGIHAGSLFPSFDGAAKFIAERRSTDLHANRSQ